VLAGDRVAVLGAGSIGLSVLLVARATGGEAYATDVKPANLGVARMLGAKEVFNVARAGEGQKLEELASDLPLDAVFVTAGTETEISRALRMVRRGGRVMVVAHFPNPNIPVDMFTLLTQEKRLQGSITYTSLDLERGIRLLAGKRVDVRPLMSEEHPLEEIQSCFERLAAGEDGLIKVLLTP
jgi:threonine dehydrogenase-like Zn-dependent dehydrogenase